MKKAPREVPGRFGCSVAENVSFDHLASHPRHTGRAARCCPIRGAIAEGETVVGLQYGVADHSVHDDALSAVLLLGQVVRYRLVDLLHCFSAHLGIHPFTGALIEHDVFAGVTAAGAAESLAVRWVLWHLFAGVHTPPLACCQ